MVFSFFGNRWNFRSCQCRFCCQVIYLPGRRWNLLLGSFRQVAELKVIISPIPTEAESSLELRFERYNFPHLWRLKLMGVGGGGDFGYTRDGLNLQQLTICDAISKSFDIKKKSEIHDWFWIFWWFFLQIYTVCIYSIYIYIHTYGFYIHTHIQYVSYNKCLYVEYIHICIFLTLTIWLSICPLACDPLWNEAIISSKWWATSAMFADSNLLFVGF